MKKLMILLIVSLCWTGVASAWDYNAEWSVASNPNGVWSYGNVELATGDFFPFQVGGGAPYGESWLDSTYDPVGGPDPEGVASKNLSGVQQDWYSWAPGQSWRVDQTCLMSPIGDHFGGPPIGTLGSAGRFTAPAAGLYDGEIIFENRVLGTDELGTNRGLPTEVWVNVNGSNVHADQVSGFEDDPVANFSTYNFAGLSLAAGDTVDFFVSSDFDDSEPWTGGDHIVGISAVIVPEPMTLSLLGLGGLALIRRRRA